MGIVDLGLSIEKIKEFENKYSDFKIARVTTVEKESFLLNDGKSEYFGKLTGNMIYASEMPEDFPTVGDYVLFQSFDDSVAMIHKIIERKTLLKRKSPGKTEYQLIAANVDIAFIMQGMDNNLNFNRLERYLTMVAEFKVKPVILLSKLDLLSADEKSSIMVNISNRFPGKDIILFSNYDKENIDTINSLFVPQKTYCLLGSSGVGKTTLLNNLIGNESFKTNEVRENDSRGRHTTTKRNLILLNNGSIIIDTPGMRELANISVESGMEETFDEISNLSRNCKFTDCTHTVEKGCRVLESLESGELDKEKYDNYIKLKKESDYYERSYIEKRKRDKEFGKMVKSIMKHKKNKKY